MSVKNLFKPDGRVALITGASRGLGLADAVIPRAPGIGSAALKI